MPPYRTVFPVRACTYGGHDTTYTRDRMVAMWGALEAEGKHRWLFYDGQVRDALDYVEFMSSPDVYAYAVYDPADGGETPLTTYFVNDFVGNAAKMHFCYLDAGIPHSRAIGVETTNFLLRAGGISALVGITPRPFRHAWEFALSVGFTKVGILPEACKLAYARTPRHVDAVLTLCTPETLLPYHYIEEETMGGGKSKKPKVEQVELPSAPAPAPPPEPTAQAPVVGGGDEGALRHKDRDAKKRGTGSLRIDLNVNSNSGTATPGGSAGLSIPRG